jgi:acyl dehydratase
VRYLDDLHAGQEIVVGSWRLDVASVVAFATEWDPQPFHTDEAAAADSIFGRLTASSLHLFAVCTRLFSDMENPVAILAMLGKDQVRFPNPAAATETLRYTTTVTEARPSASKPDRGVVVLADRLEDSTATPVMTQLVSVLVARRP